MENKTLENLVEKIQENDNIIKKLKREKNTMITML